MKNKIHIGDKVSYKGNDYFVKAIMQNGNRKMEYKLVDDYEDISSIDGRGIFANYDDVRLLAASIRQHFI